MGKKIVNKRKFCSECGLGLVEHESFEGYNSITGTKNIRIVLKCPKFSASVWSVLFGSGLDHDAYYK